jgi:dTDP-4-amino-4,6-dideoxygalactose transaminase
MDHTAAPTWIPISKPVIGAEEKQAVIDVLDSGILAQGPKVAELESAFARVVGVKHAVATSSGTSALHLALLAHGIGPGDEVITPSFTFIASVNSILFTGAVPKFVDVDEATFNLNADLVEAAIGPRTRAIMAVHLYGSPCDMDALVNIAREHNLVLIEDCAQAVGATHQGKSVGSFGTGVFSLYATKNVTSGEGGIITTDNSEVADNARLLRNHGMSQRYRHEMLGYNLRLSEIHAAIGLVQMGRLSEFTTKRRTNAAYLNRNLVSVMIPWASGGHVWHQYTIRVERSRTEAVRSLNEAGIGTGVFYPNPAHTVHHVVQIAGRSSLPVTEVLAEQVISIPVHPALTHEDLDRIVAAVNKL